MGLWHSWLIIVSLEKGLEREEAQGCIRIP